MENISEIMDEIDKFIPKTREMFGQPLTETLCNARTKIDLVENCWNGHKVGRYQATEKDLRSESNPEVNVHTAKLEKDEKRLVKKLDEVTKAMEKAFHGEEFLFKSASSSNKNHFSHVKKENEMIGSGSGSGHQGNWNGDDDGTDDTEDYSADDYPVYKNEHKFEKGMKWDERFNELNKKSYNYFGHKSFQNDGGNNARIISASFSTIFFTYLTAYTIVVS